MRHLPLGIQRRLIAVVAAGFVAATANAATERPEPQVRQFIPEIAEIRRLLQSLPPADQAWGAWLAGHAQASELAPMLRTLALALGTSQDSRDQRITSAVLDALIKLPGAQPTDWARAVFDHWPAQSLILLSRGDEDTIAPLLDLLDSQQGVRWLAAANLLLPRRPPGLASVLLSNIEIQADLEIRSSDGWSGSVVGGVAGGAADYGAASEPGFPPHVSYCLTSLPHRGATVLATGPVTIYYQRSVSSHGSMGRCDERSVTAPTSQHRLDYLAALRGSSSNLGLRSQERRTVVWRPGLDVDAEAAAFRTSILWRHAEIIRQLLAQGLLTEAEAAAAPEPRITLTVRDRRE
jgi:hypothetical protein